MDIELTHLRYFVAVAEELHFGRAAARLAISQPPLTQQIQRLEQRVGCGLFARSTRRTELTEAGTVLLERARIVLAEAERAVEAARAAGRGETGELHVGTPPSVMLAGLPKVIRWFRRAAPEVDFRLRELSTAAIMDGLAGGSLDVGFLRAPAVGGALRELYRFQEGVAVVMSRHHRLAGLRRLRLEQLAREPFVSFPRRLGAGFHDELWEMCRAVGFEPDVVQEATQWSTVVALVEAGLGVTIGPASIARLGVRGCVARVLPGRWTTVLVACGPGRLKASGERFVEGCRARLAKR